jgi:thioredoxin reductase (NADPH)
VLLEGRARVERDDPLGHSETFAAIGPRDFIAEVAQLSGGSSLIDARALTDIEALLISPDRLRALMIAEVRIGERITRALILRRVFLSGQAAAGRA